MNLVSLHWYAGWSMVLAGLLVGSVLGLFFHRDDFLGGYASFRRRLLRLGHIALVALGLFNVVFGLSLEAGGSPTWHQQASWSLLIGSVAMPFFCFLTVWHKPFRLGFVLPVVALVLAVVCILMGEAP